MRLTYTPPWKLTQWGFLPEYLWRINHGCDEDHNESKFVIIPGLGEVILWTGRKEPCDGECEPVTQHELCPTCQAPSLASLVDHICADCSDTYILCPKCANPESPW